MTKSITAVIIDDVELARVVLKAEIDEHCPHVAIIGEADNVVDATKVIKAQQPDLVFLDVEMGSHDGFDLVDILGEHTPHIIFVTGSKEYAIKAFQVEALDYLLKPVDPKLLVKAVDKVKPVKEKQEPLLRNIKVVLHTSDEVRYAAESEIYRLEADGNYTTIYFTDGTSLLVTKTLKEYDQSLSERFLRVHQSHLVNSAYIKSFIKNEGGYLLMKNGHQVPVSVRKRPTILEKLSNL